MALALSALAAERANAGLVARAHAPIGQHVRLRAATTGIRYVYDPSSELSRVAILAARVSPAAEGELLASGQAADAQAQALAARIGGRAQVEFASGPNAGREFDAISSEYVAQSKPANFALSQAFRNQAKATFQAAVDTGRTPYFQFNGPPQPGVLGALARYGDRYGIQPVIDTQPFGP